MYARVALRDAELPREAVPHPSEGRLARVPFLDPGPVRGGARLVDEDDGHASGAVIINSLVTVVPPCARPVTIITGGRSSTATTAAIIAM